MNERLVPDLSRWSIVIVQRCFGALLIRDAGLILRGSTMTRQFFVYDSLLIRLFGREYCVARFNFLAVRIIESVRGNPCSR